MRILATFKLYKNGEIDYIFANGRGELNRRQYRELTAMGVDGDIIMGESSTVNTWDLLCKLPYLLQELTLKKVILLTNAWHMARVREMVKQIPEWQGINLEFRTAESVLMDDRIKTLYKSEDAKKRIALERKGVEDLKVGRYEFA